ncbi:MAG: NAD-dependent epimerase/dehydratase family protein [Candidatus Aminicenantes bacterium]|nr:NAD-dependent epimerase/dehydratase family protein [Candidatus Aminicenantes bacterium]
MIRDIIQTLKIKFKFKYKEALPRVFADFIMINLSLISAFFIWFLISTNFLNYEIEIYKKFITNYKNSFYIISFTCLIFFYLFGFYTKTRNYKSQYKAWTIFQAVTLSYLAYTFISYFLLQYSFIPRGVTFFAWIGTLFSVGGTRLSKEIFLKKFKIEKKEDPLKSADRIKNVLLIGGAGYIGSVLVKNLLKENYNVRVLDSLIFGYQPLEGFLNKPNFEFIKGDFRSAEYVVKTVKDMDAVIHLGAIVGDPACELDEDLSLEINTAATMLIRQVCRGYGVKKFLYASTCSVYGTSDDIIDEKSKLNPASLYARSKIEAEKAILSITDSFFAPTIMRISTAFGQSYRPRFDLVVNLLTAKAIKEEKITIFNGFQWRPFIHVEDISKAILLFLEAPGSVIGGQIFNVGSNNMNHQISDLGDKIKKIIPHTKIEHTANDKDQRNYKVSFNKIRNMIGFSCRKQLEDGIIEIKKVLDNGLITEYQDPKYSNYALLKGLDLEQDSSLFKIRIS